jgi:Uma2 family endonuclease
VSASAPSSGPQPQRSTLSGVAAVLPHVGAWTEEDLIGLADDGQRHELVEGALLVSPPPPASHQRRSFKLATLLDRCAPPGLLVVEATGVRLPRGTVRIPDVVVVDEAPALADQSGILDAAVVHLAVEIVSPGSRQTDRVDKPSWYAEAGIPHFWRVEPAEGPAVHVYELVRHSYVEVAVGHAGQRLDLGEPFSIALDPAELDS